MPLLRKSVFATKCSPRSRADTHWGEALSLSLLRQGFHSDLEPEMPWTSSYWRKTLPMYRGKYLFLFSIWSLMHRVYHVYRLLKLRFPSLLAELFSLILYGFTSLMRLIEPNESPSIVKNAELIVKFQNQLLHGHKRPKWTLYVLSFKTKHHVCGASTKKLAVTYQL